MSVQVSYKKQFLLSIFFVLTIILIVEIGSQIWIYEIRSCNFENSPIYQELDSKFKRELCVAHSEIQSSEGVLLPNQNWIDVININSHGFRGPEITLEKPENTYRIFVVGGSTTFGSGATSDKSTIPGFLQTQFDNLTLDFDVEVINAGVENNWSEPEVSLIKNKILKFQPDLLIIYDGFNDITQHSNFQFSNTLFDNQFSENLSTNKIFSSTYETLRDSLFFYKTPVALMHFLMMIDSIELQENDQQFDESELNLLVTDWKTRWTEICKLSTDNNFDVIISLQPIPGSGIRELTEYEYEKSTFWQERGIVVAYEEYGNALNNLTSVCSKSIDLRNVFDDISESVYFDHVHVGDDGNKIISQKIFDEIYFIVNSHQISNDSTHIVSFDNIVEVTQLFENDLSGINLSGKILHNLNFINKDFSFANFDQTSIKKVNFLNSNLTNSHLNLAEIDNVHFTNSMLQNSQIKYSILENISFNNSSLSGLNLQKSHIKNSNLSNLQINFVIFNSSTFENVSLVNSNLSGNVDLASYFVNTTFINSNFTNTNMAFSDLHGSSFIKPIFYATNFSNSNLSNVDLSGQIFDKVLFVDTSLVETNFSSSDLRNANFTNAYLVKTNFTNANLSGIDFSQSILSDVVIDGANLTNTKFPEYYILK